MQIWFLLVSLCHRSAEPGAPILTVPPFLKRQHSDPTQLQMKDPNVYPSTMKIFHSTLNCRYADTQGTEEKLFISKGIMHQFRFGMVYKQQLQLVRDATDARNKEWVISEQLSDTKINVGFVCLPSPSLMFRGGTGWSPAQILIQLFLSFLSENWLTGRKSTHTHTQNTLPIIIPKINTRTLDLQLHIKLIHCACLTPSSCSEIMPLFEL